MILDAHCHLNDPRFADDIEAVLVRMHAAGVVSALVVGNDLASSQAAVDLAHRFPRVLRAAVGVHPHDSQSLDVAMLDALRVLARQPEVVAFGEIGLDYYYDHSPRDAQRDAFRRQLALARELALPIIIHEREAVEDVMAILDEEDGWGLGGHWHCASVSPEHGVAIARHFYLGIAGWITFPKAENIRDLASAVPLERLLVETDAPYITPVPHRGKTNEPAFVALTVQKLAEVKGIASDEVEQATYTNTLHAFPRWTAHLEEIRA